MTPVATPPHSTELTSPRTPRIFSAAPVTVPPTGEPNAAVSSTATQRRSNTRPRAQKIPKSVHARIKMLTTYGMTVEEVADLCGVPVSDIARIVSTAM